MRPLALRCWLAVTSVAAEKGGPEIGTPPLSFAVDVAALFQQDCVRCHGPKDSSGGLRLDSYAAVMVGGERGPVVVPREPSLSLLFQKVTHQDRPFMPPRKRLSPALVARLRTWIATGANP